MMPLPGDNQGAGFKTLRAVYIHAAHFLLIAMGMAAGCLIGRLIG